MPDPDKLLPEGWHLSRSVTITQLLTLVVLLAGLIGAWYELRQLPAAVDRVGETIRSTQERLARTETRVSVLEAQRTEDSRRLDEIHSDVRAVRDLLERRP